MTERFKRFKKKETDKGKVCSHMFKIKKNVKETKKRKTLMIEGWDSPSKGVKRIREKK